MNNLKKPNETETIASEDDVPENIKRYFDTFKISIIDALREEMRAELPKIKSNVTKNSHDIANLGEQICTMKEEIDENKNSAEDNSTDIKDNQEQIHKISANLGLSNLMMKEIKDSVDKVTKNTEQNGEQIRKLYNKIQVLENKANEIMPKETHEPSWSEIAAKLPSNNTVLTQKMSVPSASAASGISPPAPKVSANSYKSIEDNDKADSDKSEIRMARNKVGIYPITMRHITNQYLILTSTKSQDSPDTIYHSDKYQESRMNAAQEFLDLELGMTNVNIREVKMSHNPVNGIMWITVDSFTVKKIFTRFMQGKKARHKSPKLFPTTSMDKKKEPGKAA